MILVCRKRLLVTVLAALASAALPQIQAQPVRHVIHISVDGLRPDAVTALGPTGAPAFYLLRSQGAFTDNARADYDYAVTLPNHVTQLTGRGVLGPTGHEWSGNHDPEPDQTLASNRGSYVAGVFDVVHDHGLRTGLYASKSKFSLFVESWNVTNGAPDTIGPDDGNNKIDVASIQYDTSELTESMLGEMETRPFDYVFLHLADPDFAGHSAGWDVTPGSYYSLTVQRMDQLLARIQDGIATNAALAGHTAIILTADHGGNGYSHESLDVPQDYTLPFYLWGPGVSPGADLYQLNPTSRADPGTERPPYDAPLQPVRNGDAANLALSLLGLEAIPGSTLNHAQDLRWTFPWPPLLALQIQGGKPTLIFNSPDGAQFDIEASDSLLSNTWTPLATNLVGNGQKITQIDGNAPAARFYRLRLRP